ncbi:MAG: hypothetical protein IJM50_00940 [Lachnospiraceae bacterium]|nr:hypothetical protein [Lachnospiraceae bacterium]
MISVVCLAVLLGGCKARNQETVAPSGEVETFSNPEIETTISESGISRPEQISEEGGYFWDNATVYEMIEIDDSKEVLKADNTISLLNDRGFGTYPVTYEYSVDGDYLGEVRAGEGSGEKSPMFQTYYISSGKEVWTVFVINGQLFANPVSYNLQSTLSAPMVISESELLTSYDYSDNLYLVLAPDSSTAIVKTVKEINAETLDKLTIEEIDKL